MPKRPLKVAAVQLASSIGQEDKNLKAVLAAVDEAALNGAGLAVFPEASNNGYFFSDRQECYKLACQIPGPFISALCRRAKEAGIHLVVGITERGEFPCVYSTALLIDSDGRIAGRYRKSFLICSDKVWFEPGDIPLPVFSTRIGRIGLIVCADARIPETARCPALKGAEILADTAAWAAPDHYQIHLPVRAIENRIYVVAATKPMLNPDDEPSLLDYNPFTGCSIIIDPRGQVLSTASQSKEEIIYAEISPDSAADKVVPGRGDLFKARRPEAYQLFLRPYQETALSRILEEPVVPDSSCCQTAVLQISQGGESHRTLETALAICLEARLRYFSELMVLPELFLFRPGGMEEHLTSAVELSLHALGAFTHLASAHGVFVAVNLLEEDKGCFFSSAYLIGSAGVVGRYRKVHLTEAEKRWATPGDSFPTFNIPFGRVGMMVGYDGMFPEAARALALNGADILLWPTSWHSPEEHKLISLERALENQVFVAAANRLDSPCPGPSLIVHPLPHQAPKVHELACSRPGYLSRFLNFSDSRGKRLLQNTHLFKDRKPEHYESLTYEA